MISFIIPTLNEHKVLGKTLECLKRYRGPHEIIVSDGKSKDDTVEIAKRYTDKVIVHSKETRQTIAEGRNAGAKIASGEFLVFVDADVTVDDPNQFFGVALEVFKKDPKIIAVTAFVRVLKEAETFADKFFFSLLNYSTYISNNIFHLGAAPGEFQMMRKETFEKAGRFNEKLVAAEDFDFFRRIAKLGRTYTIKTPVYHTGRHCHTVGWPKLLWQWNANNLSVLFFKRSMSKVWEDIR